MALLTTQTLKKSNLVLAEGINEKLYSSKKRTILTADGEFQVPIKKKKTHHPAFNARVSDIWFKDEKGKLLLHDPVGESNTITNGAIYEMMHALWGRIEGYDIANVTPSASYSNILNSSQNGVNTIGRPAYNDGTYDFPSTTQMSGHYVGTNTYYIYPTDLLRPHTTLFGQLAFLNGSSGGLTGSHIPGQVTFGTGFTNAYIANVSTHNNGGGWGNDTGIIPSHPWGNTYTTLSDSFSMQASGTPQMSHSMVLSASSNAKPFTFDGIAWLPTVLLGKSTSSSAFFYRQGVWGAGVPYEMTTPTWASFASAGVTTIDDLQVSALWNPGYAITLNPGGSWGFTYTFQG